MNTNTRVLDFPANPAVGDTYKGWKWDGEKWAGIPGTSSAGSSVTVSDETPADPNSGDMWFCSIDGEEALYIYDNAWFGAGGSSGAPADSSVDGGSANSVFTPTQSLDGGAA